MVVSTHGIGISNHHSRAVLIQLHRTRGARFHVSGIRWRDAQDALSRIYAAFESCQIQRPSGAFTLHLGSTHDILSTELLDAPIALSLLGSCGIIAPHRIAELLSVGSIKLDGKIEWGANARSTKITLNKDPSFQEIKYGLLPSGCSLIEFDQSDTSLPSFQIKSLLEVIEHIQHSKPLPLIKTPNQWQKRKRWDPEKQDNSFEKLKLTPLQVKSLILSAAGRFSLLIIGCPGSGKSEMAKALHQLLPKLSLDQGKAVRSICLMKGEDLPLSERPPFRIPHPQTSPHGLIGSIRPNGIAMPGEFSMAAHGILCLDEFSEFSRNSIEALRGPMDQDTVSLSGAAGSAHFSADALIVATSNPCPCGHFHSGAEYCSCSNGQIKNYLRRISGPVADRFMMHVETSTYSDSHHHPRPSLAETREIVRIIRHHWMHPSTKYRWTAHAQQCIQQHRTRHKSSHRGIQALEKITRLHAIFRHHELLSHAANPNQTFTIEPEDAIFAGHLRLFDRPRWWDRSFQYDDFKNDATKMNRS